jgi:ATP:ADP antiporter, AAA family
VENTITTRFRNRTRYALSLPTSGEAKYRAKAAIDTFFVKISGDILSAAIILPGSYLLFKMQSFAILNIVLIHQLAGNW